MIECFADSDNQLGVEKPPGGTRAYIEHRNIGKTRKFAGRKAVRLILDQNVRGRIFQASFEPGNAFELGIPVWRNDDKSLDRIVADRLAVPVVDRASIPTLTQIPALRGDFVIPATVRPASRIGQVERI